MRSVTRGVRIVGCSWRARCPRKESVRTGIPIWPSACPDQMEKAMSYERVLPRDLFNEANLLKCIGKLCLLIHDNMLDLEFEHDGGDFEIHQGTDGETFVANIQFSTPGGEIIHFYRPLNARAAWPLLADIDDENSLITVFTDDGSISEEFSEALLNHTSPRPTQ